MEVRNGHFPTSPLIGRYCGTNLPPALVTSSGDYLTVIFVSDATPPRGTGFKAKFISKDIGKIFSFHFYFPLKAGKYINRSVTYVTYVMLCYVMLCYVMLCYVTKNI